jgi:hypothetical protein
VLIHSCQKPLVNISDHDTPEVFRNLKWPNAALKTFIEALAAPSKSIKETFEDF